MKAIRFIRYFYYLTFKWHWSIAKHVINSELKGEKKYGIDTTGYNNLKALEKESIDIHSATLYMPAVYPLLEDCLSRIPITHRNHLVDMGCGKGRPLCVAATMGYQKLTGIDIAEKLCKKAIENLQFIKQKYPVIHFEIGSMDAQDFLVPNTVDSIFLFNPFDSSIMEQVVANICRSLEQCPRSLYVIYLNPVQKQCFLEASFQEVYYTNTRTYLEASILYKKGP